MSYAEDKEAIPRNVNYWQQIYWRQKMKEIAEFMMKQKQKVKCEKCGKEFEYSVIDDVYVYLPTGNCRICCPHCKTEYNYCVRLTPVEELKQND